MEMWLRFAAHAPVGMIETEQAVYRRHGRNMSLGFYGKGNLVLPDIEQRRRVFEVFFDTQSGRLGDVASLRTATVGALATEALWEAHIAFESGRLELCDQLRTLAVSMWPK